jgi:hypothetical protein
MPLTLTKAKGKESLYFTVLKSKLNVKHILVIVAIGLGLVLNLWHKYAGAFRITNLL